MKKRKKKTLFKTKNLNLKNDLLLIKYCIIKTKYIYLHMYFEKNCYNYIMIICKLNISIMTKF